MKRDAQDVAIRALSVLVALLLAALVVIRVFDIKIGGGAGDIVSVPGAAPSQTAVGTDAPEIILGSGADQGRAAAQDVDTAADETVAMSLVTGSFVRRGGPDFSLYLDTESFQQTEMDGRCYFALPGDAGATLYLELSWFSGAEAERLAETLLSDYGLVAAAQQNGAVALGDYEALNLTGSALETRLDAYVLQREGGCLALVLCTPASPSPAAEASLRASMETLQLTEN